MTVLPWQESWDQFVRYLASCFSEGQSSELVAESIAGRDVHWTGAVRANQAKSGSSSGFTMNMPKVCVILRGGKVFEGEHLGLTLALEDDQRRFGNVRPGDEIEFRATIRNTGGFRLPFRYIDDAEQNKVFFMIHLKDVKVIRASTK